MAQSFKFTKTLLTRFIREAAPITIQDTIVKGLYFRVGKGQTVFRFQRRIKGSRKCPLTVTIGVYPVVSIDEARAKALDYANKCEAGIDLRMELLKERSAAAADTVSLPSLGWR